MDIQCESTSSGEVRISVKVVPEDYQGDVQARLKGFQKTASLRGFRKGHVPSSHFRNLYGPQLQEEAIQKKVRKALEAFIKEKNFKPLGPPLLHEEKDGKPKIEEGTLSLTYYLGVESEFSLSFLSKLSFTCYDIVLNEKDVSEAVESIQYRVGEVSPLEAVTPYALVYGTLALASKKEEVFLDMSKVSYGELLLGRKVGDSISVCLEKLFDKKARKTTPLLLRLRRQGVKTSASYDLTLTRLEWVKKADINSEMFERVYGKAASMTSADFSERTKSHLQRSYEQKSEGVFRKELKAAVLERFKKVPLPTDYLTYSFERYFSQVNASEQGEEKAKEEKRKEAFSQYISDVSWQIIRRRVASDRSIEVSGEELKQEVAHRVASELRLSSSPSAAEKERFQGVLKQCIDNREYLENLYMHLLGEKVLDYMQTQVKIKRKNTNTENFHKKFFSQT